MRRAYVDVSHFRSPYDSPVLTLTGLGALLSPKSWPVGRRYVDVAHFRAPYDQGYFQDNDLFGLGADAPAAPPPAPAEERPGGLALAVGLAATVATGAIVGFGLGFGWHLAGRILNR